MCATFLRRLWHDGSCQVHSGTRSLSVAVRAVWPGGTPESKAGHGAAALSMPVDFFCPLDPRTGADVFLRHPSRTGAVRRIC